MDIESANGKKNKDVADRLKQMIMQMLNKEEIIDPNERKRIADMKSRQLKMADDKHSNDKAKTRAQINDAHKRRMGMESFNDVFGRFISEAGFPARGKQDSDVEGDRQGVSKDPPASMNSKKEKIIPLEKDSNAKKKLPSKKADVIVINPKLNVEAADDEIVKTKMPKHDKRINYQRHNAAFPGVLDLSKILKDNIVTIPKPKTLSHIIKEKSETGNLADWAKKHEDEWTWVTISYNQRSKEMYFYVNDELITNQNGIKENKPFLIEDSLKKHTFTDPLILGYCSNQLNFFKGQIAEVKIFNKFFEDVNEIFNEENEPIFNMDLTEDYQKDNVTITNETFNVIENIIPIRREGNFYCIHHEDEGFVDGNWKKGETTARNEKRFVTEMQQRKINYKEDGLKQIFDVLDVENVDETLYPNTMFINCKMRKDVSRV
jgi:hypothetical protein